MEANNRQAIHYELAQEALTNSLEESASKLEWLNRRHSEQTDKVNFYVIENAKLQERIDQYNLSMPCGHTQNFLIGDDWGNFTCTACSLAESKRREAELERKYDSILCVLEGANSTCKRRGKERDQLASRVKTLEEALKIANGLYPCPLFEQVLAEKEPKA